MRAGTSSRLAGAAVSRAKGATSLTANHKVEGWKVQGERCKMKDGENSSPDILTCSSKLAHVS